MAGARLGGIRIAIAAMTTDDVESSSTAPCARASSSTRRSASSAPEFRANATIGHALRC
jgi:hypothetical protein